MARSYFDNLPSVQRRRSNFNLSHRVLTSMKVGKLTPIDIVEVLPGDTWSVNPLSLTRLSGPLVRPIMDDVYLDTYSFFVPLRLTMEWLEDVFGNSSPSAYIQTDLQEIPTIMIGPNSAVAQFPQSGTVGDYLGIPSNISYNQSSSSTGNLISEVSVLPFRAFALIWNEFFRDQNVDPETYVNLGATAASYEMINFESWNQTNYFGGLPPVRRYGDYYSTALPSPQKGPAMRIPGIQGAPITTSSNRQLSGSRVPIFLYSTTDGSSASPGPLGVTENSVTQSVMSVDFGSAFGGSVDGVYPGNLMVASTNTDGTISSLRTAFQLQKFLERDALYGSRYREYLYAAYGVVSPDSRLQVPEFLAGSHNRLSIQQIPSTSSTSSVPQGTYAANISSVSDNSGRFSKSFTEHGYIITVACIRYKHLYSQALSRLWRRKARQDFYDPLFANLSQQAVYLRDVYGADISTSPTVFGYQEVFADYRVLLDRVSGQMRPDAGNIGQLWSLADKYMGPPSLIDLVHENGDSWERVLAVGSDTQDPFIVDYNFQCSVARVVSPYSIPGYADHH